MNDDKRLASAAQKVNSLNSDRYPNCRIATVRHILRCLASLVIFGGIGVGGCATRDGSRPPQARLSESEAARQQTLIAGTNTLWADIYARAIAVSAQAAANTSDRMIQEDSLRWRINVINQLDTIRTIDDPRLRFVALWVSIEQARASLGTNRFGHVQAIYVDAITNIEKREDELAQSAFSAEVVAKLRPEVMALAVKYKPTQTPDELLVAAHGVISKILYIPLSPVSGLRGVGDTPEAINKFTEQAGYIGKLVERLPERTKWQVELLLLEAEHTGVLAKALRDAELAIAEAQALRQEFAKVADAVQRAPDQAKAMLQDILAKQPAIAEDLARIESTVKISKELVANADQVVQRASTAIGDSRLLLADAEKSAAAVQSATVEIRGLVADFKRPSAEPATTEPAGDDDVTPAKIQTMAVEIHAATGEVRRLLAELREPAELAGLERTADRLERIVSKFLWGAAGLIILTFAMAALYRRSKPPIPAPSRPESVQSRV